MYSHIALRRQFLADVRITPKCVRRTDIGGGLKSANRRHRAQSFNHLVGAGEQRRRHGEAERLGVLALENAIRHKMPRAGLMAQKGFSELLMFTEPKFGLRNRLCETRDHLGSLERRVRNDDAKCSGTDERDSDGNDHSNGELRDVTAHVRPPSVV